MKTVIVHSQQRWDYYFESRRTETSLVVALNELGKQGWELVDVLFYKDPKGVMAWGAFLKRPNAGPTGQPPAQEMPVAAKLTPGQHPANDSPAENGFDLSGDEFQLKTE